MAISRVRMRGFPLQTRYMAGFIGLCSALAAALTGFAAPDMATAQTQSTHSPAPASGVTLQPCHISDVEDLAACGFLTVPLNRSAPDGDAIDIHVAVLPPSGGQINKAPLYILAGGPGQAASDTGRLIATAFRGVREGREIILVDQRGAGLSAPFTCDLDDLPMTASGGELAQRCKQDLTHSPRHFTSAAFISDLEAVRKALGHEKINLWGGSYGTRAALLYARSHPQQVRAMVLDSVAPPSRSIFANDAQTFSESLAKTFAACKADKDCNAAFPNLETHFENLRATLRKVPSFVEPVAMETPVTITEQLFIEGFRGALYAAGTAAMIPYVIDQAHKNNFEPWAALGQNNFFDGLSMGLLLSVQCAEEIPRLDAQTRAPNDHLFFSASADLSMRAACAQWDAAPYPEGFETPVETDIPTLLFSGALDPVTPPEFGDEAAAALTNAKHLAAPASSHIVSSFGCAPRLLEEFFETADPAAIDGACLEEVTRPPFMLSAAGPNP